MTPNTPADVASLLSRLESVALDVDPDTSAMTSRTWRQLAAEIRAIAAALTPAGEGGLPLLSDLPKCWSGSPVTVTWAEDGETTTREVWSEPQVRKFANDYGEQCFAAGRRLAATAPGSSVQGEACWWCEACATVVQSEHVTYSETHDTRAGGCGMPVYERPTTPPPAPAAEQGDTFSPTGTPQECDTVEAAVMLAERALWQDDEGVRWVPEASFQRMVSEVERLETALYPIATQPEARGVEGMVADKGPWRWLYAGDIDGGGAYELRSADFTHDAKIEVSGDFADHGDVQRYMTWLCAKLNAAAPNPVRAEQGKCNMGVGCDEAGVCYALANGQPDRCGRTAAPKYSDEELLTAKELLASFTPSYRAALLAASAEQPEGMALVPRTMTLPIANALGYDSAFTTWEEMQETWTEALAAANPEAPSSPRGRG